jgi:hypothetical protein
VVSGNMTWYGEGLEAFIVLGFFDEEAMGVWG